MKTIKAIDFFCGAGGLTRGLLDSGIKVLGGVDVDNRLRETYEKNNRPAQFVCEDIKKLRILDLRKRLGITKKDPVIYAACTPCQPFSTLNRTGATDKRRSLLHSFAKIVLKSPPDFILVENVPGLNTACGKRIFRRFVRNIEKRGFKAQYSGFLDAQHFGVPQVRKRFILLAARNGVIIPPRRSRKISTVRECIGNYPALKDGEVSDMFENHAARRLPAHLRRIVRAVPKDGGSRADVKDSSILLKCHQRQPRVHKDVFGRMAWDRPAPTLTGRCTDVYLSLIHI